MKKSDITREKLLVAARDAFWTRGYSNVSLREISAAAGVDVALISRYFGSKLGLFEASLDGAFYSEDVALSEDWLETTARLISQPVDPQGGFVPDPIRLLLSNAADPEVGPLIRAQFEAEFVSWLCEKLTGEHIRERAALFAAALLGLVLARKALGLRGMADATPDEIYRQSHYMLKAALIYPGSDED